LSLIIATGSNLGDPIENLNIAKKELSKTFKLLQESNIFISKAVDYEDQNDFYNQVLEFQLPQLDPSKVMKEILILENKLGRVRTVKYGPRIIDIDIIFWGLHKIQTENLITPHPKWIERSFVVKPLQQLPFFKTVENCFTIPSSFLIDATPI
jgi:2-amino-4-hydroxy-6-hydroxymethyldihydropteridine diphosphokinase